MFPRPTVRLGQLQIWTHDLQITQLVLHNCPTTAAYPSQNFTPDISQQTICNPEDLDSMIVVSMFDKLGRFSILNLLTLLRNFMRRRKIGMGFSAAHLLICKHTQLYKHELVRVNFCVSSQL